MSRVLSLLPILVVLPFAAGFEQKRDTSLADQLKALVKEYQDSLDAFEKAFREVKDEARGEYFRKNYPPPERLYPRFMALADKHPKDAVAVGHPFPQRDEGPRDSAKGARKAHS